MDNNNITNSVYTIAEKYGEFCGNIFSGIINLSGDLTVTSFNILNSSYKGFKDSSQPAVDNFIENCQVALDKNIEK